MVFQRHHHARLLRMGEALPNGLDAPGDGVFFAVSLERRLLAFRLHQLVKRSDRAPTSGIEPDRRNAHLMRQVDAMLRMIDRLAPLGGLGIHEILMDRQHDQIESGLERPPLQSVHVAGAFLLHLPVQDFNAVEAHRRGMIDHFLDRVLRLAEMPVGVG